MDKARKSFSMMLQVNPKDQAAQRAITPLTVTTL